MSRASIELETVNKPEPAFTAKASQASKYTAPSIVSDHDGIPLRPLERTITVTSNSRTAVIITAVTLITAISTLLNGVTTVALPTMARELSIPDALLFWPSSIQALTNGCTLLLSGTITDALGSRFMYLVGCVLQAGFILGCGLSRNATQIIIFRGLSGVAISLCLPSAVSIITSSFVGKRRDMAFASMGGGQPIGFSIGLVLGGVLTQTIGWRWAFHLSALLDVLVFFIALWGLPKEIDNPPNTDGGPATSNWAQKLERLRTEIDWVGAVIASSSLAMLSYAMAALTGSTADIKQPATMALLSVAIALIPGFVFWVARQEKLGNPALIPNTLWRNKVFTTICVAVFLTWGSFNALEQILTFYFQYVQGLNPIQASIRFLPAPVSGALSNIAIGLIVHRVQANYLVLGGCILSIVAPLVMVAATPYSNYWATGFLANVFNPLGADSLFTISNLLITSVFPAKTQALAGGVFNTVSQIGKSVGLALVAVIASSITARSPYADKRSPEALMQGYRATFWFVFACIFATVVICLWGLRSIGKVGHKRE
ncbi:hypothetical protein BAUCODRAFT_507807 [Baudoinia panamericana UAMH 10762]|uniref:Major facilitator superfamily (MFS) profile domain-containing protein n=1 Tax=Baudoinia panamericana (strain UAMH 10762) TaxID=717646 RepID=M2MWG4_BAUPA|nr:uncharacterized protein BAUCODRAFT_507807 [Baudoinia panamericana UAMH 10762]EMC95888.1 hypothetical protein BAUCODRAFT_507807 [Baudoinia panamericana UAMH 10762]